VFGRKSTPVYGTGVSRRLGRVYDHFRRIRTSERVPHRKVPISHIPVSEWGVSKNRSVTALLIP